MILFLKVDLGMAMFVNKVLDLGKVAANISFIIVAKTLIAFKYDTTCI